MSTMPFRVIGALTDDQADLYIERQADRGVLAHLRRMDYLLVIEPRQQGKTSLINYLMCQPGLDDVAFVYLDVTTPGRSSATAWYQTLCPRILRQLRDFIPRNKRPPIPRNSAGWREFLCEVALCAADASKRVIIALDEIGAVTFPGATEFFSVLRDVYNSRQAESELKQLTFLLAGTYHPRDLIQDDRISPFNIAQRVRLDDFTLSQVQELVSKGDWSAEQAVALAQRIHYWTDGQPYLTQMLCANLGLDASVTDVDVSVERLRREDENHLPPLVDRLQSDEKLCSYAAQILTGKQIKFYPREHRRQAQLELLGVIKEGQDGFCTIRNRIYQLVLPQALNLLGESVGSTETEDSKSEREMTISPKSGAFLEIEDALNRGSLTLFLGADLPSNVTGLPSRADLALHLAHRQGLDDSLSLAEVAQRVTRGRNRWEFTTFIRDQLDTTGISPQPFHHRIVELVQAHKIESLITTAYDNLLELAFQEAVVPINRVVRGSDVSFINPNQPTLIKLYGDVQQPDTLIVTADDHYGLWRDRDKEDLLYEVRTELRRQTLLFLGYNLSDPDFNLLWREVLDRGGRFARTAYAIWSDLPEGEVQMWRDRGIIILENDPLGILRDSAIASPHNVFTGTPAKAPLPPSPTKGKTMDYERGLDALKQLAEGGDWYQDFTVHEAALRENLRDERRYGPSEQTRRDRTRIVDQLNALALQHLDISFNDLCLGKQPTPKTQPVVAPNGDILARLRRIEAKLDQGLETDRLVASQILDAIAHNRVAQSDATQMVVELQAWVRTVQQTGLPLNADVREALDALAAHQGSAYQYLQLALPIIPGILSYNVELGSEHQVNLKTLWERIKIRLTRKTKGDSEETGPNTLFGTGNRWAVLIGVNAYEDWANYGALQVCVKDVHAIREQLIAGGFDADRIRLLTDETDEIPTRANILVALKAVADATEPDDLLLFYYSGHGDESGGESYLVARNGRRLILGDTAVPLSRVKEIVEQAPARAKIIVLDACHSGADIGGKGPTPMSAAFIRRVFEQAEGLAVLASCKQGQLSYEWRENERSVFTHFLLEALAGAADQDEKGFVTVQDTSRYVTNGVKLWASQRNTSQTPTLQYTVAGDIILVRYQ